MRWSEKTSTACVLYRYKTATWDGGLLYINLIFFKITLMQTAISSNGFLKIPKQIAKWGSGYIKKKKNKFSPTYPTWTVLGEIFSLSCTLENNFGISIILRKDS